MGAVQWHGHGHGWVGLPSSTVGISASNRNANGAQTKRMHPNERETPRRTGSVGAELSPFMVPEGAMETSFAMRLLDNFKHLYAILSA